MKCTFTLLLVLFGLIQSSENCGKNSVRNADDSTKPIAEKRKEKIEYKRLPENIKPETKVRRAIKNKNGETVSFEITTVENRLNELDSRYENDKLVDGNGKEIRFYKPLCRGVSRGIDEDENDRRKKEEELAGLEERYTVIILHCDPQETM